MTHKQGYSHDLVAQPTGVQYLIHFLLSLYLSQLLQHVYGRQTEGRVNIIIFEPTSVQKKSNNATVYWWKKCWPIWVTNFPLPTCLQAAEALISPQITSGDSLSLFSIQRTFILMCFNIGFWSRCITILPVNIKRTLRRDDSIESITKGILDVWPWNRWIVTLLLWEQVCQSDYFISHLSKSNPYITCWVRCWGLTAD